ncbi:MAG: NosD domain-containing protein [Methanobacteriota archaeon]
MLKQCYEKHHIDREEYREMNPMIAKKRIVMSFVIIVLLLSSSPTIARETQNLSGDETSIVTFPSSFESRILFVGGSGPGNYTSIQVAITAANNHDTVFVYRGTYYENLVIDKPIRVIGEDNTLTFIDGRYLTHVVQITVNDVYLSGFTIQHSGEDHHSGVIISGNNTTVHDCILRYNINGIVVDGSRNNITQCTTYTNEGHGIQFITTDSSLIRDCVAYDNFRGIVLIDSWNNCVERCEAFENNMDGILLSQSHSNTVRECCCHDGIWFSWFPGGITLCYDSFDNLIQDNYCYNYTLGISVYDSAEKNVIMGNRLSGGYAAVELMRSSYNTIQNNIILGGERGVHLVFSRKTIIRDNQFSSQGIVIDNGFSPDEYETLADWNTQVIENNTAENGRIYYYKNRENVVVPSDAAQVLLANCSDCVVQNLNICDFQGAIQVGFSSNILIQDNTVMNSVEGLRIRFSSYTSIMDNMFVDNNEAGVAVVYSHANTFKRNMIQHTKENYGNGVFLEHSTMNVIDTNTITGYGYGMLCMQSSARNHILNNTVDNSSCIGLLITEASDNTTIQGNIIQRSHYGLNLGNCSYNTIIGNIFSENEQCAIYLDGRGEEAPTTDNLVSRNTVMNNGYGIEGIDAQRCIISMNMLSNNNYGVCLWSHSQQNIVYDNMFTLNQYHARDTGQMNQWDNGYPCGGNYWDNYSGVDVMHGPDQNLPGGDNIGDTTYVLIGGVKQDRYPLMHLNLTVPPPKNPMKPNGPTSGVQRRTYRYITTTFDPNGDSVYYVWDWGDGSISGWLGPYDSGQTIGASHQWRHGGIYLVRVKAKNSRNMESDWSDPIRVTIHGTTNPIRMEPIPSEPQF